VARRDDDALAGTLTPDGSQGPAPTRPDPLGVTLAGVSDAPHGLPVGTSIGRYQITGVLGHGGMGVVYAALDPDLARAVAIKLLRPELRTSRARLLREGQAVARLRHPNVVTVHDVGTHDHDLFIAMELVAGGTLGAWLRERRRPWREVLARLIEAGRGLAAAHAAGLVHRDFKPENVLLGDDGRVVVTDFGLAAIDDDEPPATPLTQTPRSPPPRSRELDLTRTGALMGTPAYMSPEQFRGRRADARSDQFSFCITLYEALVGVRPFDPRDGSVPSMSDLASAVERGEVRPMPKGGDVPAWLRRAVARGLRPDPAERFPSMTALLDAITPPRRARAAVLVAGVAAVVAIAGVVVARDRGGAPAAALACPDADAIDVAWSDDARATYLALVQRQPWADEQLGWLDDYAARWRDARRDACGVADPRAAACLDDALVALRTAVASRSELWPALPDLGACARPPPEVVSFPHSVALGPQGVAALSPDGRSIACSDLGDDAYVIDADPDTFRPRPIAGALVIGDWLTDDRMLVQHADGSQALRAPDGVEVPLPGKGDLLFTQTNTISPDGGLLAVQVTDAVEVLDVATGARRAVIPGAAHEIAWEPGGARLAVVARNLSTLRMLDVATGVVTAIPLRVHARGLGEVGIAWLAPGRLVFDGGVDASGTLSVWTLELDEASRLRRAPAIRYTPPVGTMIRVFDAAAGRVLVEASLSRQRMFRFHDGHSAELPSSLGNLRLAALDLDAGRALAFGTDQLVRFDLDGKGRTVMPDLHTIMPTLRAGEPQQVVSRGANTWEIVELGDGGARVVQTFAWKDSDGAPFVRCASADTTRCLIAARAEETLRIAPLRAAGPGEVTTIDGVSWNPDLAEDGRRALVPALDGRVLIVDLVTHAVTTLGRVHAGCTPRTVRWHGDAAWAVELCPDRFAIGEVTAGGFREVVTADGWISGLEALPGGDFLYSEMDWDPQVQILDGL